MKWFYFYTPNYVYWHNHLQKELGSSSELTPILVRNLELKYGNGHHFVGQPLKIELLTGCIRENLGESIVFSDCTLFVNHEKASEIAPYMSYCSQLSDLTFADNTISTQVNIGIVLINCNMGVLKFWEDCLVSFGDGSWDQALVNEKLRSGKVFHQIFNRERIVCNYTFDASLRNTWLIYKQFVSCKDPKSNWNERLAKLQDAGLLSSADTLKNLW